MYVTVKYLTLNYLTSNNLTLNYLTLNFFQNGFIKSTPDASCGAALLDPERSACRQSGSPHDLDRPRDRPRRSGWLRHPIRSHFQRSLLCRAVGRNPTLPAAGLHCPTVARCLRPLCTTYVCPYLGVNLATQELTLVPRGNVYPFIHPSG
jgi:hypothetical protein